MNYRLMACGQFNQEEHEDIEDDDTPDTEDYEEDSESDVEDDNDSSASKDYCKEFVGATTSCVSSLGSTSGVGRVETPPPPPPPAVWQEVREVRGAISQWLLPLVDTRRQ